MCTQILGMRIDSTSYGEAVSSILAWAKSRQSRYVCAANVHMVMEGYDHPDFRTLVNAADLITPDGMPLVWSLRRMGFPHQQRVYGPDLTILLLKQAQKNKIPVGFLGSTPDTLRRLEENVRLRFPGIAIAYTFSPPFGSISTEEDDEITLGINKAGVPILFIGLGCPKQEKWMAEHVGRVNAVMIGVGAAFDFLAGTVSQAPHWIQRSSLEWLFRLNQEPGRLWRRYLYHNPRFLILVMLPLLFKHSSPI